LRTDALPVFHAIQGNAQAFFGTAGVGVVEAQTLDEGAVATHAL